MWEYHPWGQLVIDLPTEWAYNVPVPPTSTARLIDRIIPGGLHPFLTEARQQGETCARIADRLAEEHEIEVSAETVRRWVARPEALQ